MTEPDFINAFLDDDANAILLITHGLPSAAPGESGTAQTGKFHSNWYLTAAMMGDLTDKAVFLAVCDGLDDGAIDALLRETQQALILVAPTGKLLRSEAEAFLPTFFEDLADQCQTSISPEAVQLALDDHGHLAGGKMHLKSAVG